MESFASDDGHLVVRLDPGDLALESLRAALDEHGVDTGAVVSGIGTFRNLVVHYVHTTDIASERADRNTTLELDGAWEVTNVEGVVANGEPHLHVSAFDGERTVGGHLEEGNEVNVLAEFAIREFDGLSLTRREGEYGISKLRER